MRDCDSSSSFFQDLISCKLEETYHMDSLFYRCFLERWQRLAVCLCTAGHCITFNVLEQLDVHCAWVI